MKVDCNSYWNSDVTTSERLIDFKGRITNIFSAPGGLSLELKQIKSEETIKISEVPYNFEKKIIKNINVALLNVLFFEENQTLRYKFKPYSDIVFIN